MKGRYRYRVRTQFLHLKNYSELANQFSLIIVTDNVFQQKYIKLKWDCLHQIMNDITSLDQNTSYNLRSGVTAIEEV